MNILNWVISDRTTPPTSTKSVQDNLSARIFPNPARNTLQVILGESDTESIQYSIVNIQGKIKKKGVLSSASIDVLELINGIYVLQLETEKEILRNKIVIE